MAIKSLKIDDELLEKLELRDPKNPLGALIALVRRFIDVEPADRALFIPAEARQELERIFGRPIDSTNVEDFTRTVKRISELRVGEARIKLSVPQELAISYEARAQHLTPKQLLEQSIPQLISDRFGG